MRSLVKKVTYPCLGANGCDHALFDMQCVRSIELRLPVDVLSMESGIFLCGCECIIEVKRICKLHAPLRSRVSKFAYVED